MDNFVPTKVFLTKGVGRDKYKLKSFEQALRQAGVAQTGGPHTAASEVVAATGTAAN